MPERAHSMLLADLYELTMSAAFFESHFNPIASFELFVRKLPRNRGYLITAGLEQALEFVESARFGDEDVEYVRRHPSFKHVSDKFFEYLRGWKFAGEIWAMPEGTPAFANEPLLRVTAPIIEAQLLETYLLASITFQTSIATKAARVVEAAEGRDVIEFGSRRAHGPEAGVLAARAAYVGGCQGTSNVDAGFRFGIPTQGTLAHSYVMAFRDETEAFASYTRVFPDSSVLLIDTYDVLAAVDKIIAAGLRPRGIRLDSGDLVTLSKEVRRKFDHAGLRDAKILASGDLDEFKITELLAGGARIDGFGVGTALATSLDAPALGGVYKLVEVKGPKGKSYHAKFSADKVTYPASKQVFRFRTADGSYSRDLIASADEHYDAEALLKPVMQNGRKSSEPESLDHIRQRVSQQFKCIPCEYRQHQHPAEYPVAISAELQRLLALVKEQQLAPNMKTR